MATGLVTGATLAAFTGKSISSGNQYKAKPDWIGPSVSVVLASKGSGADSYVHATGTYRVYANVPTDGGNPPSGTSTVTADVSSLTPGTTAAPLTAGTYTLNGTTYNYQSAALTVGPAVAEGAKSFTLTATDAASNQTAANGTPVVVDNTAPATTDVQSTNKTGGTVGRIETGDKLTFTVSEKVEPSTILSGWDGASTAVTVHVDNIGKADRLTVYDAADANQTALGSVTLDGKNYVNANVTFTNSTMVLSASAPWTVTVTLGTPSGAVATQTAAGSMQWAPLTGITDVAGNALPTTTRTQTGAAKVNF